MNRWVCSNAYSRIPFQHEDIRAYIDTFFLDGSLKPIEQPDVTNLPAWVLTGVVHDPKADAVRRFRALRQKFQAKIPTAEVSHRDWQQAAQRWAELVVLRWEWDEALEIADRHAWTELQSRLEDAFAQWMLQRYGSLHNLPYHQQPVMVHQVPRFLAVERKRKKLSKIALLVLDGLAFDQWLLIRKILEGGDPALRFQDSTAFAWVPTLTSVTRQSIFAGEPPLYFPDSIETTSKERSHWLRFWEDQGVQRSGVELVTNLDGPADPRVETVLANPRLSVLGVVWNKVDDIMHGMHDADCRNAQPCASVGVTRPFAAATRSSPSGRVCRLPDRRSRQRHGDRALGTPEKACWWRPGANEREFTTALSSVKKSPQSSRTRFAGRVMACHPARHVLLAGDLKAFTDEGDEIVAHGGIALEEVMVPFVAITREGA